MSEPISENLRVLAESVKRKAKEVNEAISELERNGVRVSFYLNSVRVQTNPVRGTDLQIKMEIPQDPIEL